MNRNNILIEFSATIAEILNNAEQHHKAQDCFIWQAWRIESDIVNLLSGRGCHGLNATQKYSHRLVGSHMSAHQDKDYAAQQYFDSVLDYQIGKRQGRGEIPTDRLQEEIRSHCLLAAKSSESNLSPISLWGIFLRAGQVDGESAASTQECHYRYWHGEEKRRFKLRMYDVLSSANRHYAEIYRLGLYPPEHLDSINVSQARKLSGLINSAKALAEQDEQGRSWQHFLEQAWQAAPLKKLAADAVPDYATFARHPIIRCLLALDWTTIQTVSYDENPEEDDWESMAVMAEASAYGREDALEDSFYDNLAILEEKINDAILPVRDKERLFRIVRARDISDLINADEDENAVFEHLRNLLNKLWHQE